MASICLGLNVLSCLATCITPEDSLLMDVTKIPWLRRLAQIQTMWCISSISKNVLLQFDTMVKKKLISKYDSTRCFMAMSWRHHNVWPYTQVPSSIQRGAKFMQIDLRLKANYWSGEGHPCQLSTAYRGGGTGGWVSVCSNPTPPPPPPPRCKTRSKLYRAIPYRPTYGVILINCL